MAAKSRRDFLKNSAIAGGALATSVAMADSTIAVGQAPAGAADSSYEMFSTATAPYAPVRVVNWDKMPWDEKRAPISRSKRLFKDPDSNGSLAVLEFSVGVPGEYHHYHTFHEWAYNLSGDYTNNEGTIPAEDMGPLNRFREGAFMDRPPYSLHGGEKGREEWMQSQVGASMIILTEGGHTYSPDPHASFYNPDWKNVKSWKPARIIDTIGALPWQPEGTVPGLHVKYLADDPTQGFRATLWWLEAGWNTSQVPEWARGYYYKQAQQFNFVIFGDLAIQAYKAPDEKAETYTLSKSHLFQRSPMSLFGLQEGVVTKWGCVWLEVTYSKGCSVNDMPIEDKIKL